MKVHFISDSNSWFNKYIEKFISENEKLQSTWCHNHLECKDERDVTFILSYSKIIKNEILKLSKKNIVIHASKLPEGKGMSPMTWQVLEGKREIPLTLFEAIEGVDSGQIYLEEIVSLDGGELLEELRSKIGEAILRMMTIFMRKFPDVEGRDQVGRETFYRKRTPIDSELDINKSLLDQFNLLRVCDNSRYPAFFFHNGNKYIINISKE